MRRIHYGWVMVAVGLVTLVTAARFRSTTGILIVPLQDEFGWSRATIGFAVASNLGIYGVGRPFGAAFNDPFGVARGVTVVIFRIPPGGGLSLFITQPWQLDPLWGGANAAVPGAISVPLGAMIANRWFVRRCGPVTAVLTATNPPGQLIFLPILAWIVTQWG